MSRRIIKTSALLATLCLGYLAVASEARQIRYNRFGKQETAASSRDLIEVPAIVREVKEAPYPAAGYRPPGRAFNLPGEEVDDDSVVVEGSGLTTTTETAFTSTTTASEGDETTTVSSSLADNLGRADEAPYPPAGLKPSRAFLLPTESRTQATPLNAGENVAAPYPAAGYRPSRIFLLPTEVRQELDSTVSASSKAVRSAELSEGTTTESNIEETTMADANAPTKTTEPTPASVPTEPSSSVPTQPTQKPAKTPDNSKHPVCGVSLNPLKPTPPPGTKDDPDAERVFVNDGHTVIIEAENDETSSPAPPKAAAIPTAIPALGSTVVQFQGSPQALLLAQPVYLARSPVPATLLRQPASSSSFSYATQVQSW